MFSNSVGKRVDVLDPPMDLETYALIWFDCRFNSNEKTKQAQQRVRSSINHLRIFENVDKCIDDIRLSTDDQIILVLDAELSEELISDIHDLSQVIAIYIYNINDNAQKQCFIKYFKIKGLMMTVDDVVSKIEKDQIVRERKQTALLITFFDRSSVNINGDFLHSELIIDALVRMNSYPSDKSELIEICRQQYKDNPFQLDLITEFERNYTPERALWWYTRETFLYKVLNATLRKHNVDLLLLFQFLIRDIYEQLKQLQKRQLPLSLNRVYRGQLMSTDEIAMLMSCEGQLVSMNSFLSTTRDRGYALALVESGLNTSDEFRPVLFEIDLDSNMSEIKPYADISRESAIPTEDELLIMLGSMFRLNNVNSEDKGRSWTIRLSLSNHDQNEIQELFDCIKIDTENDNVLYSLGSVLIKAGYLTIAERCYRRYLTEQPEDTVNAAKTYQALGSICQRQGDYDSALELLNKAVDIFNRTLPFANPFIAITYSSIGNLYLRKKDTKTALSSYKKALDMFKQVHGDEHPRVAMCYNNMGAIYDEETDFDQALLCYEQALVIGEKTLPSNHPDLAASHMNVGITYANKKQYELALEYLECSLQIKLLSLPSDHVDIGDTYGNMAAVYERQENLSKALSFYKKALTIFVKSLPPTHSKVVSTQRYIEYLKQTLF